MAGRYRDRSHAGQVLAGELFDYVGRDDLVVLGLARGGVPVAAEVASRLRAPLDAFLVRKLGAPGNPELAMGAIATGGVRVLNDTVVRGLQVGWDAIEATAAREADELAALGVEVVCPLTPSAFYAVGEWYDDFAPPTDEEIRKLLAPGRQEP